MNQFQSTNIQIAEIEAKMASTGNMKYVLTATDKKKYYFYQNNKNGESDAYGSFKNMEVKQGSIINISFTEEEKSFTDKKGSLVKYTDRFIGSMREADAIPAQTPTQPQKTSVMSNSGVKQQSYEPAEVKNEKFWDKKAYKQCLWNFWLEKYAAKTFGGSKMADGIMGEAEMTLVWNVFNQIEKDAEKRFATGWDKAIKTFGVDEAPLPEDIGSEIPF